MLPPGVTTRGATAAPHSGPRNNYAVTATIPVQKARVLGVIIALRAAACQGERDAGRQVVVP
jgi:hypothetical protein